MAEYIEKQAVLDEIDEEIQEFPECEYVLSFSKRWIKKLPPADVRPVVKGRWLTKEYMYGDQSVGIEDKWVERLAEESDYYAYCSVCGNPASYSAEVELVLSNSCPHCWADMRGGDAE